MPRIRVVAVSWVNIRLSYDRLVCHKRSSLWQSLGGDSRMRPLSNSAECPDVMDPERGSVFRCCGSLVPNGSRSCASVEVPCREGSAAWQAGAALKLSGALRGDSGSEVQCRTGAFWGNQGLTGALRFLWLLPSLTAQFRAAALLRLVFPVVLATTCENAVAAIRRPTGV